MADEIKKELIEDELEAINGGGPAVGGFWEGEIGPGLKHIDIYRAGVTYVNCAFGNDEFYINSRRISKDLANTIVVEAYDVWVKKYRDNGDLVGFTREWQQTLMTKWSISWDGKMGEYKTAFC